MNNDVTIRTMTSEDIAAVRRITDEVFRPVAIVALIEDKYGLEGHDWLELKMQQIDDDLRADAGGCMVAVCNGEVGGYITCAVDKRSGIGRIPNLAVGHGFQGLGLSKLLMESAVEYLKTHGMKLAKIETLETNELCREYYPRLGFEEIARQIHFVKKL